MDFYIKKDKEAFNEPSIGDYCLGNEGGNWHIIYLKDYPSLSSKKIGKRDIFDKFVKEDAWSEVKIPAEVDINPIN